MLRVLIAGDADDMRNRMVAVLSRTYEVVGIVTTAELFQVASSIRPDVIVCDIFIPLFLQQLHAQTPLVAGYLLALTAAGWSGAYLLFFAVYGPYLLRPDMEP